MWIPWCSFFSSLDLNEMQCKCNASLCSTLAVLTISYKPWQAGADVGRAPGVAALSTLRNVTRMGAGLTGVNGSINLWEEGWGKSALISKQTCHVIPTTGEMVRERGNVQPPLTSAGLPITTKLVSIFTFTAEGPRMVVADGVGATDLRSLSALIDVW